MASAAELKTKKQIVVFGPGPRFKGGIANFTCSLAKALYDQGASVSLVSWSQQYPSIIPRDFIDKKSKADLFDKREIPTFYLTNYNNPFSWKKTADFICSLSPEKVIFQWAIAIQGLPMGKIARYIKEKSPQIEIVFDVHNVIQKENGKLDKILTRYALRSADTYIMHGQITIDEFHSFMPEVKTKVSINGERHRNTSTILKLYHPVYDMFAVNPDLNISAMKEKLGLQKHVFLFFGFIRKYKGLHHAIKAFAQVSQKYPNSSLLIVGESFWDTVDKSRWLNKLKQFLFNMARAILLRKGDSEQDYKPLELIKELKLHDRVVLVNEFVPNEEVNTYFQVSDAIVNFYEYATPSGVESIAYNFNKPILATKVGHFKYAIIEGENGYLAEAGDIDSMANAMEKSINSPIQPENLIQFKEKLSWSHYAQTVLFQ